MMLILFSFAVLCLFCNPVQNLFLDEISHMQKIEFIQSTHHLSTQNTKCIVK